MKGLIAFLFVGLGGAIGSMTRYGVGLAAIRRYGPEFPFGTCFVNITGSFLIGLLATLLSIKVFPASTELRLVLITGFLGGYTTFSTYALETNSLADSGEWVLALINFVGTAVAGFVAVRIGVVVARLIF
jgi:CrcB protein